MNWYFLSKFAFRNKNDLLATSLVRKIFSFIKQNLNKDTYYETKVDNNCDLFLYITFLNNENNLRYKNFDIRAFINKFKDRSIKSFIRVELYTNRKFSSKDYDQLQYILYDATRHEINHYFQSYNEEHDSQNNENNETLNRFIDLRKYILQPDELEAYIRGLMFTAKKQKKPFETILNDNLNGLFFVNDQKIKKEILNLPISKKIIGFFNDIKKSVLLRAKEIFPNVQNNYFSRAGVIVRGFLKASNFVNLEGDHPPILYAMSGGKVVLDRKNLTEDKWLYVGKEDIEEIKSQLFFLKLHNDYLPIIE